MPVRKAIAVWEGSIREGKGVVKLGTGLLEAPYSFSSRFESGAGTNSEELVGAAHAGCFSMALAGVLGSKATPPRKIETTAEVLIEKAEAGFRITSITLRTRAEVPGASETGFLQAADEAKANCPLSRALTGVRILLDARLVR